MEDELLSLVTNDQLQSFLADDKKGTMALDIDQGGGWLLSTLEGEQAIR